MKSTKIVVLGFLFGKCQQKHAISVDRCSAPSRDHLNVRVHSINSGTISTAVRAHPNTSVDAFVEIANPPCSTVQTSTVHAQRARAGVGRRSRHLAVSGRTSMPATSYAHDTLLVLCVVVDMQRLLLQGLSLQSLSGDRNTFNSLPPTTDH